MSKSMLIWRGRENQLYPQILWSVLLYSCCLALLPSKPTRAETQDEVFSDFVTLSDVRTILAPRVVDVEVLGDKPLPKDLEDILRRVRESWSKNAEWLAKQLKNRKNGEPIPYHPNFGVTHEEWNRFQEYMENLAMVPIATARLQFTALNDAQIKITSLHGVPELNGTIIDFDRNEVVTRWGNASAADPIKPSREQKATGPMSMCHWRFEKEDRVGGNFTSVELSVGRLVETPHNLIYLRVTEVSDWKPSAKHRTVVRFAQ